MRQTLAEKVEALKSLLPLLVVHLDRLPIALRVKWLGAIPGGGGLHCDGWCETCPWSADRGGTCRGERWEVEREMLERRYRLKAVRISLEKLRLLDEVAHNAVWNCYVEPVEDPAFWLTDWYRAKAEAGVTWMAQEIPGELVAFGEDVQTQRRRAKERQIREMLERGHSGREIIRVVRCSWRDVLMVKKRMLVRCKSPMSAVG